MIIAALSWLAAASGLFASELVPRHLRCEFQERPLALQTTHPRFGWTVEAMNPSLRGLRQTAYRIVVSSSLPLLARHQGDLWDSGKTLSNSTIQIAYEGKPVHSSIAYYWSVEVWDEKGGISRWSAPAQFRMGLLDPHDWKGTWIASPVSDLTKESLPLFRREFLIQKTVAEAIAYISGLGQYELHINGAKIGDDVLTPGWTDYRKTVFYNSYDVTRDLRRGLNAIGIMLGNGMYNVERTPGRYTKFAGSFGPPKLICQVHIRFTDGSSFLVVSDSSWHVHGGPITFSSPYGGEDYDARLDPRGWDIPGFDDRQWPAALETDGPGGRLLSQESPPTKVEHIYQTERVTQPKSGVHVYDLGQNFAGWPELDVRGAAGSTVKLIPGELLDSSGLVSQRGSGGPQWFSYTLKGGGIEIWHPRFSYYGFRYVQVELQAPPNAAPPEVLAIKGQFIHASAPKVGHFRCSDELFNRIHSLIDAAIENNMQSVLTDCPHREKLGWLEETHLLGSSVMYNYDLSRLYEKISGDMRDAQAANGFVPDIAPEYVVFAGGFRDSPEWGSAIILDPWIAYQHYGDLRNLSEHYGEMKRYATYLSSKATGNLISYGLGDWYDVGPGEPGVAKLTSLGVTGTAIYYQDLLTLERVARLLGKQEDEIRFEQLVKSVRSSFNSQLYNRTTHGYDRGSQTDYAMPLALGIVPDGDRTAVLEKLVSDIRAHQNHVTAGDIGFHYVVSALIQQNRSDVLFDMLSRTDSQSYGYQLRMGATALTEAWDANPRYSQDHFMLGHAEEWFYRTLGGIDFDLSRPDAERIVIRPSLVGDITEAEASYQSKIGTIACSWKRERGNVYLQITIPPNATALVYIPTSDPHSVTEGGHAILKSRNIIAVDLSTAVYRVASGQYCFAARY